MRTIALVDTSIVDASRDRVFSAMEELTRGRAQWWLPRIEVRPVAITGDDLTGSVFELLARKPRGPITRMRVVEALRPERLRYEYLSGVMVGSGEMTLTAADGKTVLRYDTRWKPKNRLQGWLLQPVWRRTHSGLFMPAYFTGLKDYLARRGDQ
ncbi:MAG: hypothetical protein WCG47_23730 [Dermatophilaceae bacterium]